MRSFTLIILLVFAVMLVGCVLTEEQQRFDDGSLVFIDNETGKPTKSEVDSTGKENAPFTLTKPAPWIDEATDYGMRLPNPWGQITTAIGGLALIALSTYSTLKNRKRKSLLEELIISIEEIPEAKEALKKEEHHSLDLKKEVRRVT